MDNVTPYYDRHGVTVHSGECVETLARMDPASVDAVVCDPPYALSFMGREWDSYRPAAFQEWCRTWAAECLRVLKPGGHLLAFGGSRTGHRLAGGIEDAGFDIRDTMMWIYGTGMPKGAHVLKPAYEPIVVGRKPVQGTVAACIEAHGTGALNVDRCRVEMSDADRDAARVPMGRFVGSNNNRVTAGRRGDVFNPNESGRWPTNTVFVHQPGCGPDEAPNPCVGDCQVAALDAQSGMLGAGGTTRGTKRSGGIMGASEAQVRDRFEGYGDPGGASRYFPTFRWEAKAPTSERPKVDGIAHPTVKPLALMRWLVRLVTPAGGLVLDPFAGSGTTGQAARAEGMRAVLIEREAEYLPLIEARLDARDRAPVAATGEVRGDEPMDLLDLLNEEAS